MRGLHSTLADDYGDKKHEILSISPAGKYKMDANFLHSQVGHAKRYVLDDAATKLMVDLSECSPREMARMLHVARPKHDVMWVEIPANTFLKRRIERGTMTVSWDAEMQDKLDNRPDSARMGLLMETKEDTVKIWCVEHGTEGPPKYFTWPIGFGVSLGEAPPFANVSHPDYKMMVALEKEVSSLADQARLLWGYTDKADIRPLIGKCRATAHPSYAATMAIKNGWIHGVLELSGLTRVSVSLLAMMNSVPVIEVEGRPSGRHISQGVTKPYGLRTSVTLNIPKRVRKIKDYAAREISREIHRKRFHMVVGHWRYLDHKPQTEGWEPTMFYIGHPQQGNPAWRKRIASHGRGDKSLGEVDSEIIVRGPRNSS